MHFEEVMEHAVHAFELVGVAILAVGSALALIGAGVDRDRKGSARKPTRRLDATSVEQSCSASRS